MYKSLSASFALCLLAVTAQASSTNVPGMANPWLAGMPDGSTIIFDGKSDTAPAQSPTLVSGISLAGGVLVFSNATGGVHNGTMCPDVCYPPDGRIFQGHAFVNRDGGAANGIADVRVPMNALLGVFLDNTQPDLLTAPTGLDFETIGLDFLSLAPTLRQVFFVGDGFTGSGSGVQQQFVIPVGATRLFLGTMDGNGWANNTGEFNILVSNIAAVPVPASIWLLGSALGALALRRRQKPAVDGSARITA